MPDARREQRKREYPMTQREQDSPALTRALQALPAECPDLQSRVQGRVRQARTLRRGGIATAVLLVVAGGLALQLSPGPPVQGPLLAENRKAEQKIENVPQAARAESLSLPSPVAQLDILSDQQAAVWASLERLTEEL